MKKILLFIAVAILVFAGCTKKPAEQKEEVPAQENQYIDITALTPEGTELSLSDLVGKTDYVLLDFWASWCGPCRRYIPVLKELYASQPEGRLQILSCSVDQDEAAWREAIEKEQMAWPQMRQDAEHECADLYEVAFIPHTVLIDREGKIVGIDLDEPEIAEILLK